MRTRKAILWSAVAGIALLAGQAMAAGETFTWNNGAGDGLWSTDANWDSGLVPTNTCVAVINNGDTVSYSNWTNENLYATRVQYGTLNIESGYLEATAYTRWWDCWVGSTSSTTGTVNQTGGTAVLGFVEIARNQNSTGIYNLSGGELDITYVSRMSGYHFFIGTPDSLNGGGTGLFEISNDAIFSTRYGVHIGAGESGSVTYATNGTFSVVGSDCSIDIGNYPSNSTSGAWYQSAHNTLKLGVDANGISPINIHGGSATFEYYSELDPYFVDGVTPTDGKWTVMVATNGTIEASGLVFADGVDTSLWNMGVSNGNELWISYGQGAWGGLTVPSAPVLNNAWPTNPTSVYLSWDAAGGAQSYNVKRSEESGTNYVIVASGITNLTYSDTVATDDTYYYVVSASNSFGEGENSSEENAVVIPYTIITYGEPYSDLYTAYSAFDEDTSTHYDGETQDAWIGLDFGANNKLQVLQVAFVLRNYSTAVAYATNATFQGANSADFSDAVTLATVGTNLLLNPSWNTIEVTDTTAYRYVRLNTAPQLRSKSFAEVKFYTTDDYTDNGTLIDWLEGYGLTEADDVLDADSDGLLTWEEYVAGTVPTNDTSVLELNSIETTTNGLVISWQSVAGKSYNVISKTSVTGAESTEATVTGLATETSYTGTVSDAGFYRITVE